MVARQEFEKSGLKPIIVKMGKVNLSQAASNKQLQRVE